MADNSTVDPANFSSGLRETVLTDLPLVGRGKVRDKFQLPNGDLFIVTTDRISVGDMVVGTVPGKGAVLNLISDFWFDATADLLPNHKLAIPHPNALVAKKAATVLPVETVLRRYMAASQSTTSIYYQYSQGARVIYGLPFPDGLTANQELPMGTLITPTTKSDVHDLPLTDAEAAELVDAETGKGTWARVKSLAVELFDRASATFKKSGLLLADTKVEFGLDANGELMVIDELFTPDSSRLWLAGSYEQRLSQGLGPENFDKEKVRAYLYEEQGWRPDRPVPRIPEELKAATYEAYHMPYKMVTGKSLPPLTTSPDQIQQEIQAAASRIL